MTCCAVVRDFRCFVVDGFVDVREKVELSIWPLCLKFSETGKLVRYSEKLF